ncbi:putative uncharacterized protein [Firmicutes bacterium CAG:582]|nr:putative uncharacterized protein [Firmicutes bacterium CAG:582]
MKIDLFKLNNLGEVTLDSDISFDESYYINAGIRKINNLHISGTIKIDYDDCLISDIDVIGEFILPCAISLEDVSYPINVKIEENMGKFEDFYNKNKNTLDILPFIWENIVSEVPIRVVKEEHKDVQLKGEGWEVISD